MPKETHFFDDLTLTVNIMEQVLLPLRFLSQQFPACSSERIIDSYIYVEFYSFLFKLIRQ